MIVLTVCECCGFASAYLAACSGYGFICICDFARIVQQTLCLSATVQLHLYRAAKPMPKGRSPVAFSYSAVLSDQNET
jgi:hypothetical protein